MNVLNILIPLYILITMGFIFKKVNFPSTDFWPHIERMTYYVLLPPLVFVALMKATVDITMIKNAAIVTIIPALLSVSLQWFGFLSPHLSAATFTSMFQGALRNNTIVSLVVGAWLVPDNGLAIMAVIMLMTIPLGNVASILVLLRYATNHDINGAKFGEDKKNKWWNGIIQNPLIMACVFGLAFNILGFTLPQTIMETAEFLGRSALPFALLTLGAGLKFGSLFKNKLAISLSSLSKMIITPLLSWGLCILLGIEAELAKIAIIYSAIPTAVSAYILAKQMGGDAEGMAQIITFQIVVAVFTLPLFILIAQQY